MRVNFVSDISYNELLSTSVRQIDIYFSRLSLIYKVTLKFYLITGLQNLVLFVTTNKTDYKLLFAHLKLQSLYGLVHY